ncbi:MAG: hypothetical protein HQ559_14530 [Lentisphaerae bacterium]|nr:hypothetical protein [Lentisphaerota bacterium]
MKDLTMPAEHVYNGEYSGDYLDRVAFPLGGMGAGMVCMEGTGALSHVSVRNQPDIFNEPLVFAALAVKGREQSARVLEGPVPSWKLFGNPLTGYGGGGHAYGLPRFDEASFESRFPFATVALSHPGTAPDVTVTGWSPFVPGNADDSSLPFAALEYGFENSTSGTIEAVFSFHARNFMSTSTPGDHVTAAEGGFVLNQPGTEETPWHEGAFSVVCEDPAVTADCAWFRGGWFDPLTILWRIVSEGRVVDRQPFSEGSSGPGGSLYVPFSLQPGQGKVIRVLLNWYVPKTDIRTGEDCPGSESSESDSARAKPTHVPWYAGRFADIGEVTAYSRDNYDRLRGESKRFCDCFYDTTLPPEVVEAVAANLTILKSPTVLRQTDGRLWGWEGCHDDRGCCPGSCTHVWNYAQALPHLFPEIERGLRHTDFDESQDELGHQEFRSALPVHELVHKEHAAADGQLGGIMKAYREWRLGGDIEWLRRLWPRVKTSLEYCIATWDPDRVGVPVEPHHNTYDVEFWGPDGMCGSFYVGALRAASLMAEALGEDPTVYRDLCEAGTKYIEEELFNGEYYIQKITWQGLRVADPTELEAKHRIEWTPEALALAREEGPKYQYGNGCLSDGVLGAWLALVCGVGEILDQDRVRSHLLAVHEYNLKRDLSDHANPQRPTYAAGHEGGLLLCTWPKGGALSLPFPYSNEVWTGIEYQVASHLMFMGCVDEGLEIVRTARSRYDGRVRNPFNEYECGHWYARAMSSYGLLEGLTGVRYDAVDKELTIAPRFQGDFRTFCCTATGYGTVGVKDGKPFIEVRSGEIDVENMDFRT